MRLDQRDHDRHGLIDRERDGGLLAPKDVYIVGDRNAELQASIPIATGQILMSNLGSSSMGLVLPSIAGHFKPLAV